jgi:hypothetical protein
MIVPARNRAARRLRCERGQSMVEFALVFPLLVLLLFGVMEFARAFNYWNDLNQLAADGARFASVNRNPGPSGTLGASLLRQADAGALRRDAGVCIGIRNNTVGQPVQVRTTYTYDFPLVRGLVRLFDDSSDFGAITMHGSATMRLEQQATPDNVDFSGSC